MRRFIKPAELRPGDVIKVPGSLLDEFEVWVVEQLVNPDIDAAQLAKFMKHRSSIVPGMLFNSGVRVDFRVMDDPFQRLVNASGDGRTTFRNAAGDGRLVLVNRLEDTTANTYVGFDATIIQTTARGRQMCSQAHVWYGQVPRSVDDSEPLDDVIDGFYTPSQARAKQQATVRRFITEEQTTSEPPNARELGGRVLRFVLEGAKWGLVEGGTESDDSQTSI